jgi:hypothetical protein
MPDGGKALADTEIGQISLHLAAKLVFTMSHWKGRGYAHVRKFVSTSNYSGPTKSGLAMPGEVLVEVIEALRRLQAEVPGKEERKFARVPKSEGKEIFISIVPPDDLHSLPYVDVREYFDTPEYKGPTKKGFRFSWDKLSEIISLLLTQAQRLGAYEKGEDLPFPKQLPIFPERKPQWVEDLEAGQKPNPAFTDMILAELLPDGPKDFPGDFLVEYKGKASPVKLPNEPIEVVQQSGGTYIIRSNFGFCHCVRNACEGNFILYASLRGHRVVHMPQEMITVFKAVKGYENYLRELRRTLLQAYERKSGHRPTAEYQAKQVFRKYGLPWVL